MNANEQCEQQVPTSTCPASFSSAVFVLSTPPWLRWGFMWNAFGEQLLSHLQVGRCLMMEDKTWPSSRPWKDVKGQCNKVLTCFNHTCKDSFSDQSVVSVVWPSSSAACGHWKISRLMTRVWRSPLWPELDSEWWKVSSGFRLVEPLVWATLVYAREYQNLLETKQSNYKDRWNKNINRIMR